MPRVAAVLFIAMLAACGGRERVTVVDPVGVLTTTAWTGASVAGTGDPPPTGVTIT